MNASTRFVAVLSTLLAVGAWAEHPRPPTGIAYPPTAPNRMQQLDARLQRAQAALEAGMDNNGRERKRALREALDEITAARAELAAAGPSAPLPPPQLPRAIRAERFASLLAALQLERSPEAQLSLVNQAAEGVLFQATQAQAVLGRIRFDAFRLRAAAVFAGRLIDPEKGFLLQAQFSGAFDQRVLGLLLAGAAPSGLVVAADAAQLRLLINAVFQPSNSSDRLRVLTARAGDQLLTAHQLRCLLDGFSTSRERLLALQALNRRLVDPQNLEELARAFGPHEQHRARQLLGS